MGFVTDIKGPVGAGVPSGDFSFMWSVYRGIKEHVKEHGVPPRWILINAEDEESLLADLKANSGVDSVYFCVGLIDSIQRNAHRGPIEYVRAE